MSQSGSGITRRQLAALASATTALAQRSAETSESELESARENLKQISAILRKERIATLLDPGFVFRP